MNDPIKPLTPEQQARQEKVAAGEGYVHRVLVGLDQEVNVIADGQPDETISSRAARAATQGKWWGRALSSMLNLFQPNHGAKAQASDLERAQAVEKTERDSGNVQ